MDTDRDPRHQGDDENDTLAGGDFTDELTDGQAEADDESGSTGGAAERRAQGT
ncbi:hypothetical protein HF576_03055 [Microbacterium sp. CFH 90308]|uniref:Uncharacterized protein n=1 Tax=Microbacterium salsuginis TaxID=2722803 RepID=A0ABX1K9K6_9MICO|nr:hypothetical protein [Microbacterium sp. CFH 90308]NLP82815.1 hypothetical protein [Microbacterium sp. CFH 90308]